MSEWVSVKDRLPSKKDIGTQFLLYVSNEDGETYFDVSYWFGRDVNLSFTWRNVTHWMPLPEPPKEE